MVTTCGVVRVAVAFEPLWFGSISMCVFHVSGCGWSCVLESWPLYARSRYENHDGGAMTGVHNVMTEHWVYRGWQGGRISVQGELMPCSREAVQCSPMAKKTNSSVAFVSDVPNGGGSRSRLLPSSPPLLPLAARCGLKARPLEAAVWWIKELGLGLVDFIPRGRPWRGRR
jgi:hypothetical protein